METIPSRPGVARLVKSLAANLSRLIQAAGRAENLPYVILAGLMLVSLVARLGLILR